MQPETQLELFARATTPILDRAGLHQFLAHDLDHPVTLTLTTNRVSMIDFRQQPNGTISLRLHRAFLQAPPDILATLRRFLRHQRAPDWRRISTYVQSMPADAGQAAHRHERLSGQGAIYDLETIRDQVNRQHFEETIRCRIGWGQAGRPSGKKRRSIRYGSCDVSAGVIRIHPLLDQEKVPPAFVEYVVFHEMLHLKHPPRQMGRAWRQHPPEFRQAEQAFPEFRRMRKMAGQLLTQLD